LVPQVIARRCEPRSAQPFLGEEHFFQFDIAGAEKLGPGNDDRYRIASFD
jgi:hypothetical protein